MYSRIAKLLQHHDVFHRRNDKDGQSHGVHLSIEISALIVKRHGRKTRSTPDRKILSAADRKTPRAGKSGPRHSASSSTKFSKPITFTCADPQQGLPLQLPVALEEGMLAFPEG